MRAIASHIVITAAILASAPAVAQVAAPSTASAAPLVVKPGDLLRTADGKSIGNIAKVQMRHGQPVSVSLIYNQRFIRVPASTLSPSAKGVVTSLSRKELAQL